MTSRVYKSTYKPLLRFKENLLNDKKLYFFKKNKWSSYLIRLKKQKKQVRDHFLYHKPTFGFFFKKSYFFNLLTKQKLSYVYGILNLKYLKSLESKYKNNFKKDLSYEVFLFNYLESRLDSVLRRSKFVKSYRQARQWISLGHILVNDVKINKSSYITKKGDIISLKEDKLENVKNNLYDSILTSLPIINYEIDYRSLKIYVFFSISPENLLETMPLKLELNKLSYYLKKT